jgi:hypothetical protein
MGIMVAFPRDETLREVLRELTPPFAALPKASRTALDRPCARCGLLLAISASEVKTVIANAARLLCPWCAAIEFGDPAGHLYRVH